MVNIMITKEEYENVDLKIREIRDYLLKNQEPYALDAAYSKPWVWYRDHTTQEAIEILRKETELQTDINGSFTSKKGIEYRFTISKDLSVVQYKSGYDYYVRCPGGSRVGRDKYVNPTKELKEYIKSRYGLDVWNY